MICKVRYCNRAARHRGYCKRHYNQWNLTGRTKRNGHDKVLIRRQATYAEVALRDVRGNIIAWSKIDKRDIARVSQHPWSLRHSGYAGSTKAGYLHRFVMDAGPNQVVHHVNRDRRDNRRGNLQIVDLRANIRESVKARKIGVTKTANGKWLAGITATFSTKSEAVEMRESWERAAGWYD